MKIWHKETRVCCTKQVSTKELQEGSRVTELHAGPDKSFLALPTMWSPTLCASQQASSSQQSLLCTNIASCSLLQSCFSSKNLGNSATSTTSHFQPARTLRFQPAQMGKNKLAIGFIELMKMTPYKLRKENVEILMSKTKSISQGIVACTPTNVPPWEIPKSLYRPYIVGIYGL